ncbi:protein-methionine-sulfoxide reductase catalytic subunit MsrP [Paracoccus luteus]|uniref:protein-methionine-sulfoxide reductase catalytic subunit MsrP n=1 Tax=Paracoccus luteus TaxID=2508543 RepID=UPI0010705183|nr:protein-methionine-sulfoxide reductase catalytic subunit MsrP [Paracoccus luteus]
MKLNWSDVTPEAVFLNRRAFLAGAGVAAAAPALAAADKPNSFDEITNYNNFYEFGAGKTDPAENAGALTTAPWAVQIDGLVDRPGSWSVADIAPANAVEDRIYRLRCVEAWSMVIPWQGVPLADVLARAGVQPGAKFVAFETLLRPEEMPAQRGRMLDWPYREGLRIDEAMHPLTLLATGLYGKPLRNQNGAPIRLVVPWKYGFKSIKSIVRITLTDRQPVSTWQQMQPSEYGFYANVNPTVDHPRWSQASERRIGAGLLAGREETLMFNGYADQVAQLYAGMDLARDY